METKESQFKVIDLLARHERVIGDFYKNCAEVFPEKADFWSEISGAERIHAKWLEDLKEKVEREVVYVEVNKFTESSINNSIEYIEEETEKLKRGDYNLEMTLSIAFDLERALLEGGNLNIFTTSIPELKHFLDFLKEETQEHAKIITEEKKKLVG